ncbi:chemotaxis protein CheA [Methylobacterium sp. J-072]|uniref:chemotaxis protein CheA n=1 Tax=Methylobacterium sp. J-072 TaxID=2836651 RepID=UPI001FB95F01|nr:chemotaxis protein CheA [Methylobacterium sp. J-072]MCJ2091944.1 chemotaxis protein CheA [Methylobacterium sp. J-072]
MTNPLLARFIPEARELLQVSASGLLKLERNPTDETAINEVFRAVHTIKGSSGLFDAVALTRLVHAAEDLLGEVRSDALQIDSSLVDMLLDSLDQVGQWIDELERRSALPTDADGVAHRMAALLRQRLGAQDQDDVPDDAPADAAPQGADPAPDGDVATLPPGFLARLSAPACLDAFRRACGGQAVHLVRYAPEPGCFFNGTDPLQAIQQVPGALALDIAAAEPWGPLEDLDPYQCNLHFSLLTAAPRPEIEQAMRYELDQITIAPVRPRDLVRIEGEPSDGPIWDDFREAASAFLAAGRHDDLRTAVGALRSVAGPTLWRRQALDWLEAALSAVQPDSALVAALVAAAGSGRFDPAPAAPAPAAPAPAPQPAPQADPRQELARSVLASQHRALEQAGYDADRLASVGTVVGNVLLSLGRDADRTAIQAAFEAAREARSVAPVLSALSAVLDGAPLQRTEAAPALPDALPPAFEEVAPVAGAKEPEGRIAPKSLKVDQAKIDLLMNLIGELVVSKNALPFLAKRAEETYASREMSREIKEQYAVIDRLAQEMQGAIMQVRMLPVSEIFDRFPRLVRDLARKLGKRIDLALEGEDTAADKTIIEALGDPLLHIVRNSLDHGLESPDERRAAGKSATARILLKARQEADSVVIEVQDNGRGIDPVRIRAAAIAKGVIGQEEADRLSDQEAINLIYRPGFSTAAEISDLSGRGVGMDVVLTTVEKLGGQVSVSSRLGEGTTTRLALPLSMAVTRIMIVEAAGSLYGVPMDMIVETVRVPRERIRMIKKAETFVLRETIIPLLRLSRLLHLPDQPRGEADAAVLVCHVNGRRVGLIIDNFREGMDVILKPLEGVLTGLGGYAGTTLLGDGRVLLVLDLRELL